jgi:hypothetical protein
MGCAGALRTTTGTGPISYVHRIKYLLRIYCVIRKFALR